MATLTKIAWEGLEDLCYTLTAPLTRGPSGVVLSCPACRKQLLAFSSQPHPAPEGRWGHRTTCVPCTESLGLPEQGFLAGQVLSCWFLGISHPDSTSPTQPSSKLQSSVWGSSFSLTPWDPDWQPTSFSLCDSLPPSLSLSLPPPPPPPLPSLCPFLSPLFPPPSVSLLLSHLPLLPFSPFPLSFSTYPPSPFLYLLCLPFSSSCPHRDSTMQCPSLFEIFFVTKWIFGTA